MRPSVRCAGCAMRSVLQLSGSELVLLGVVRDRAQLRSRFHEPQPMLELGDPEFELVHLLARDQAKLPGNAGEAVPGPLAEPRRVAAPPRDRVLQQLAGLVAAHPP